MTSAAKFEPIDGIAIFTAEAMNGVKNEANVATSNAITLLLILCFGLQDFSIVKNNSPIQIFFVN